MSIQWHQDRAYGVSFGFKKQAMKIFYVQCLEETNLESANNQNYTIWLHYPFYFPCMRSVLGFSFYPNRLFLKHFNKQMPNNLSLLSRYLLAKYCISRNYEKYSGSMTFIKAFKNRWDASTTVREIPRCSASVCLTCVLSLRPWSDCRKRPLSTSYRE